MKRLFPFLILLLLFGPVGSAVSQEIQNASVKGFVRDAATGETLLLANVIIEGTQSGTATNTAGFYTLAGLVPGTYTLLVSYLGYRTGSTTVVLAAGEHLTRDIELQPIGVTVGEVVIQADRERQEELSRLGVAQLTTSTIRSLPSILEADVFRSLQLLPGVKAASDYSSGLYIRGGSPDQTLILLDRTTVYNPTHFFGFFSTFNPDAIKDVRLYKGGFPAEYGGRIGSVVDVYNKDGNRREYAGRASLGLLASRFMVEGPYKHGSWMVAARRSTLEPVLAGLRGADIDGIPDGFYFYDLNAKLNVDLTSGDRLSFAGYTGRDVLDVPFLQDARLLLAYGNRTFSANWTHLFSDVLFSNFTLTASRYSSQPDIVIATTEISRDNTVHDFSAKGDFEYLPNERIGVKAGFWWGVFTMRLKDIFDGTESLGERIHAGYGSAYVQQTWRPDSRWTLTSGLRVSYFGEGQHLRLEPRASAEYQASERVKIQAGVGRYAQYLTLITSEAFSGLDLWLTTGEGVAPAFGDQFVSGIKTTLPGGFGFEIEGYYRSMRDIFQLDPFLIDAAGVAYADLFHFGDGFAYGTEVLLTRSTGRVNGLIGYTAGATRRRFPNLNDGDFYPPKYDRTHDVNAAVNYELSRRWRATAVFTYATGQAYTKPASQYRLVDFPFATGEQNALISPFNAARLPSYHRLDIGFTNRGRFFRFADYELQLQVINAYARRNVWFYFYDFEDDGNVKQETVPQIPVPIPNISFSLIF